MSFEPKNCPFCDSEYLEVFLGKSFYGGIVETYVFCSCGAEGPKINSEYIDSEEWGDLNSDEIDEYMFEKAIISWNKRI